MLYVTPQSALERCPPPMVYKWKILLPLLCGLALVSAFLFKALTPAPAPIPSKRTESRPQTDHPAPLPSAPIAQSPRSPIQTYKGLEDRNLFGPPSDPPPPTPKRRTLPPPPYIPQEPSIDKIYTGYFTIDDQPYAVLEDSRTHSSSWLKVGDDLQGYTVAHIDPTGIQLRKGAKRRTLLLADRFNAVPLAGDAPGAVQPDPGNLTQFRGRNGRQFNFLVTGAVGGNIWGTGVYTDDSTLAAAAVHAGILRNGEQGVVQVTILPGQDHYDGSFQNGVNSGSYANWDGSYRISRGRQPQPSSGNLPLTGLPRGGLRMNY